MDRRRGSRILWPKFVDKEPRRGNYVFAWERLRVQDSQYLLFLFIAINFSDKLLSILKSLYDAHVGHLQVINARFQLIM